MRCASSSRNSPTQTSTSADMVQRFRVLSGYTCEQLSLSEVSRPVLFKALNSTELKIVRRSTPFQLKGVEGGGLALCPVGCGALVVSCSRGGSDQLLPAGAWFISAAAPFSAVVIWDF